MVSTRRLTLVWTFHEEELISAIIHVNYLLLKLYEFSLEHIRLIVVLYS